MPITIDEDNLKAGLLGLIVALVEVIKETLEREALRRMESDKLSEQEIERLGRGLMELDQALEHIKADNDISDTVKNLRVDLDRLVEETIETLTTSERLEEVKVSPYG